MQIKNYEKINENTRIKLLLYLLFFLVSLFINVFFGF